MNSTLHTLVAETDLYLACCRHCEPFYKDLSFETGIKMEEHENKLVSYVIH